MAKPLRVNGQGAVGGRPPQGPGGDAATGRLDEGVEKREQHYAAHLAELEGIEGRVTYAGPREELVQFSKDLDLLIVGSRN